MKVKISEKLICIPPYLSTTWDQVAFLQTEKEEENVKLTLILHLTDGQIVKVPDLDPALVDLIFNAHIQYIEKSAKREEGLIKGAGLLPQQLGMGPDQMAAFQIRLGNMPQGIEGIENAFQHNSAQANTPNLPKELVEKIAAIAKVLTGGDTASFPKPEPHCNCVHCQVARSLHSVEPQPEEEVVNEEDLRFRSWEIVETNDNLYTVTNPIDPREHYNVYLGSPIGCTCGENHCEHLKAVLLSN